MALRTQGGPQTRTGIGIGREDLTSVRPLRESHAIESVSFGVEWSRPIAPALMRTLEDVYEASLRDELPRKKQMKQLSVTLEEGGRGTTHEADAMGWLFERYQPSGQLERSVALRPEILAVTCHTYTRWSQMFKEALRLMEPFLPLIAAESGGVSTMGMQYVDTFVIEGAIDGFTPGMVLNSGSQRLPQYLFGLRDLWHAHHGNYSELAGAQQGRRLTVINVDRLLENGVPLLRINSLHRTVFAAPLPDPAELYLGSAGVLHRAMVDMHDENKAILRDLLAPEMQRRIGLDA